MKSYDLTPTSDSDLFRVVDRAGNWAHYLSKPTGTYLRAVNAILEEGYAKGRHFYEWLKNKSALEVDEILKSAGDRGDAVHQFIVMIFKHSNLPHRMTPVLAEDNINLRSLRDDEWDAVLAFETFWLAHDPVLIDYEQSVANLKLAYAGTYDARIRLTKKCGSDRCPCRKVLHKLGLYDWKTGGGIYPNYGAQLAAYEKVAESDYTAILRLGTRHRVGYEFEVYNRRETRKHFREFRAAREIANVDYKPFNAEKEIYEIPETLKLTVRKELKTWEPGHTAAA